MLVQNTGIIMDIPPRDVDFYLRAGYEVLDEKAADKESKAANKTYIKKAEVAQRALEAEQKEGGRK